MTPDEQLRTIIDRIERLNAEKQDIADDIKEVYAEAKGNGYDTAAIRRVIAIRKRDRDELAHEEAVVQTYLSAMEGK